MQLELRIIDVSSTLYVFFLGRMSYLQIKPGERFTCYPDFEKSLNDLISRQKVTVKFRIRKYLTDVTKYNPDLVYKKIICVCSFYDETKRLVILFIALFIN